MVVEWDFPWDLMGYSLWLFVKIAIENDPVEIVDCPIQKW